ncbi:MULTISPECIES: ABC transporter permease [Inquilinus]|jgi:NitT/TauT family transport system permease protein|uniref:NitT/TauT family transport system permease protein n=1 Tax=Inquilinus ginsengisoli TaxID=363840 RepID=A0ABU1JUN6_9PROT|nr:ABC transporter permease subunit [Inquilinus ginsengisoli]MDR6292323.1 NitT/TauT family transport system permease protein [Inquilinus ginsengisoli]
MRQAVSVTLIVAVFLVLWQVLHLSAGTAIPGPGETLDRLRALAATPAFWGHCAETGQAFLLAAVLSIAGGLVLGVLLGSHRLAGGVSEPILINLYALPKVTLYPVVLLIFGLGMSAKVAFGVMHGMIPLALFTMNAILQTKPVYRRTASVMRLTPWQAASTVILPAIVPEVMSGVQIAVSLALLGVLIGELFASQRGLGFLARHAMELGDMPTVLAVAATLIVFALALNAALRRLARIWS